MAARIGGGMNAPPAAGGGTRENGDFNWITMAWRGTSDMPSSP